MIAFFVDGAPQPQARARVVFSGGKARAFTPGKRLAEWRGLIKSAAERQPASPHAGAWSALFSFQLPKGTASAQGLHICKPDVDNLAKAVLDVLRETGKWFADDAQVARLIVEKALAPLSAGGVTIELTALP